MVYDTLDRGPEGGNDKSMAERYRTGRRASHVGDGLSRLSGPDSHRELLFVGAEDIAKARVRRKRACY